MRTLLAVCLVALPSGAQDVLPVRARGLSLRDAELRDAELRDAQSGELRRFRGVPLRELIEQSPAVPGADLLLLYFENGMVVPLPLHDDAAWERLAPFVAFESTFPPVAKKGAEQRDRRPLEFHGTKLVVKSLWHPFVPEGGAGTFSPWSYVDTLTGFQCVQKESWYRKFQPSHDAGTVPGYTLFFGYCQYCHGARNAGANYGWDFVEPVPLYTYRGAEGLFLHVRYRSEDAPELGLMMPAFKEFTPEDAQATFAWLKSVAEAPP